MFFAPSFTQLMNYFNQDEDVMEIIAHCNYEEFLKNKKSENLKIDFDLMLFSLIIDHLSTKTVLNFFSINFKKK